MHLAVGTFNLNNLFSRFNFEADISTASTSTVETTTSFTFSDPSGFKLRTYKGRLVKEKPAAERKLIADRIKRIDLDVLAVQEVEDVDTLRRFVTDDLDGLYKFSALIEGNDPRLIDVGLLSKRPFGGVTSWQFAADPADPDPAGVLPGPAAGRSFFGRSQISTRTSSVGARPTSRRRSSLPWCVPTAITSLSGT
jgi:hypothetical protein